MCVPSFTIRAYRHGTLTLWRVVVEQYRGVPQATGPFFRDPSGAEQFARRYGLRRPLESALLTAAIH